MRHVMLTLALCSACAPPEDEAAPRAREDAVIRRYDDDGIIIMNGLSPLDLGENLLLNDALTRSKLIASSLTSTSFSSGELHDAVTSDPRALRVLEYVVRCALGPASALTAAGRTFRGEAELCPAWATGSVAGDPVCQARVTACLLGVSNVVGAHVPVSMRGDGLGLSAALSVHPSSFTTDAGLPVASLEPCATSTWGVRHDCGWEPVDGSGAAGAGIEVVFACTPGSVVNVGAGSTCPGGTLGTMGAGSDKVLRVCGGTSACDSATALGENEGACGSWRPFVSFTCPAAGSYVVMQRDYAVMVPARTPGTMTVGHSGGLGAASEASLFPVREGAFFGTLFEGALGRKVMRDPLTGKLVTKVSSLKDPVFERLYSCLDAEWDSPEAYAAHRLCALDGAQCLSNTRGVCQTVSGTPGACATVVSDAPAGSGFFKGCLGTDGVTYDDGLTTFLREPCALISQNPQTLACKR